MKSLIKLVYNKMKKIKRNFTLFYNKLFFKIDKKEFIQKIKDLGIKKGDDIYVHTSLSNLGYTVGGADTIIDSLLNAVGNKGNIVMPTYTVIREGGIFNENTPCWTGMVSEALRKRKGSFRSIHPTHSVVAIGPLAKYLVKDHEKSKTPFGRRTPYHKMAKSNFKILLLGTKHNSMDHYIQDLIGFPNLFLREESKFIVNNKVMYTKMHDPLCRVYILDNNPINVVDYYFRFFKKNKFIKKKFMKVTKIGNSNSYMVDMNNFLKYIIPYSKSNIKEYKKIYNNIATDNMRKVLKKKGLY